MIFNPIIEKVVDKDNAKDITIFSQKAHRSGKGNDQSAE